MKKNASLFSKSFNTAQSDSIKTSQLLIQSQTQQTQPQAQAQTQS